MKMEIKDEMYPREVHYITLETPEEIKGWLENYEDLDDALYYISELTDLDCTTNHNTAFGYGTETEGEYNLISDFDGVEFSIKVTCNETNKS